MGPVVDPRIGEDISLYFQGNFKVTLTLTVYFDYKTMI